MPLAISQRVFGTEHEILAVLDPAHEREPARGRARCRRRRPRDRRAGDDGRDRGGHDEVLHVNASPSRSAL
jgi:hypothetical protein